MTTLIVTEDNGAASHSAMGILGGKLYLILLFEDNFLSTIAIDDKKLTRINSFQKGNIWQKYVSFALQKLRIRHVSCISLIHIKKYLRFRETIGPEIP